MRAVIQLSEYLAKRLDGAGFGEKVTQARRAFLKEFETMPPGVVWNVDSDLAPLSYRIEMTGWATLTYDLGDGETLPGSDSDVAAGVLFYLKRFIRKWYKGCADVLVEDKLRELPVVLEYGSDLADVVEGSEFFEAVEELAEELGLDGLEWAFWESEYVPRREVVFYVQGADYFILDPLGGKTDKQLRDQIVFGVLEPILQLNRAELAEA